MTDASHRVLNPQGASPLVLICDHASNFIPAEFGDLGVAAEDLRRHIAWDIGAAAITEIMARRFDAVAVLSAISRLVADCNRHRDDPTLAPAVSDGTVIPGNRDLTHAQLGQRWDTFHQPYHRAIERAVEAKLAAGQSPIVIAVHSMTEAMKGVVRPWQIALCADRDRRLTDPALAALRRRGDIVVGDNEPYNLDPREDYSIPRHAMARGLHHLQVEFRQDEVETEAGQARWAAIFSEAIESALAATAQS